MCWDMSDAKCLTHPSVFARYSTAISDGLSPLSRQARIFFTAPCNSPSAVDAVNISGAGPDRSAMSGFGLTIWRPDSGSLCSPFVETNSAVTFKISRVFL